MSTQKSFEDYKFNIGNNKKGRLGKISDVPGVLVGHCTTDCNNSKTGVSVIMPRSGNMYSNKCVASAYIPSGIGESLGLMHIKEVGTLETPIALTNSFNIGQVHDAVAEYTQKLCQNDNTPITSLNPLVLECGDESLNNGDNCELSFEQVQYAIDNASADFEEGDVGAGKAFVGFGLRSGVGSASRVLKFDNKEYTIGILSLLNCGELKNLKLCGKSFESSEALSYNKSSERSGFAIVLATDLPLTCRQLNRVLKRCSVGIVRAGVFADSSCGEIYMGFTTGNDIVINEKKDVLSLYALNESSVDLLFAAVADATEEAVLRSLLYSKQEKLPNGSIVSSLSDLL